MMHEEITSGIIQAFYNVYNSLGYGFLEKVYENAISKELKKLGFRVDRQKNITVYYEDSPVGEYFADLVVQEIVIVELKATDTLREEYDRQLINYLRATDIEIGLLLNFGRKPEFRRKIFSNDRKLFVKKNSFS